MNVIVPCISFTKAEDLILRLIERNQEFDVGLESIIDNQEGSSNFNKIIGVQSLDGNAKVLIDNFENNGLCFLFEVTNKQKIYIRIKDMSMQSYLDYIDYLNVKLEDCLDKTDNDKMLLSLCFHYKPQEIVTNPMTLEQAEIYVARLIEQSRAFQLGSEPYYGRLKSSYGYNKIIGIQSMDHQVRTRIDFDEIKGCHFNFENFNTGEKICIPIINMNKKQYERYIDRLNHRNNEFSINFDMESNSAKTSLTF